jgi:hypothetical protein
VAALPITGIAVFVVWCASLALLSRCAAFHLERIEYQMKEAAN